MAVEHVTPVGKPATPARSKRRKVPWSFIIAGLAIAGAIIYLVAANTGSSAEYYLTVNELRTCTSCSARTVRVSGIVVADSIVRNDATQTIRFQISDTNATKMAVVYSGVVPDIFRVGVQVVVEGTLGSDGVFHAQNLLTKCPSKFQSATPPPSGQ